MGGGGLIQAVSMGRPGMGMLPGMGMGRGAASDFSVEMLLLFAVDSLTPAGVGDAEDSTDTCLIAR